MQVAPSKIHDLRSLVLRSVFDSVLIRVFWKIATYYAQFEPGMFESWQKKQKNW